MFAIGETCNGLYLDRGRERAQPQHDGVVEFLASTPVFMIARGQPACDADVQRCVRIRGHFLPPGADVTADAVQRRLVNYESWDATNVT